MDSHENKRSLFRSRTVAFVAVACLASGGTFAFAQMGHHGGHSPAMIHGHGADGTGHDEVNMPGLKGVDATPRESEELAIMFREFARIVRRVENLPDGIRTVTFSRDEELMAVIASHVVGMIERVDDGRDPQIMIQSPTLDIFFERTGAIQTELNMTDEGIVVVQTSDDPEIVAALQAHAAEVTRMVDKGMQAVHEMMAERAAN